METRTVEVFQFDELSDKAKATARDWYREATSQDFDADATVEDFIRVAELFGIEVKTDPMGRNLRVYWRLSYAQGDFAAFDAYLGYRKGCVKAVKAYAPKDERLHRLAKEWAAAQRAADYYKAEGSVTWRRGMYGGNQFDWSDVVVTTKAGDELKALDDTKDLEQVVRDLGSWLYAQIREEYEWATADEQVDESIRANEYEFTADGKRFRY